MNNINLNELRNRAYKTACEHGFHDKELSNEPVSYTHLTLPTNREV